MYLAVNEVCEGYNFQTNIKLLLYKLPMCPELGG